MLYRISEASTFKEEPRYTYFLVDFWLTRKAFEDGDDPYLTNDFFMQLQPEANRIVTREADGWLKLADGSFVDPSDEATGGIASNLFARETVQRNTRAEVRQNILAYWRRAQAGKWSGDHTGDAAKPFRIDGRVQEQGTQILQERDADDPLGLLARVAPDVGTGKDV